MKYLGIDYGTKRIGIAISDENGEFAFPKMIVSPAEAIEAIKKMCEEENVGGIVLGRSVASNGVANEVVSDIEKFKEKLNLATRSLPIFSQDEGFSSMEAHRYQTDAGRRDDSAAAIILQRFLDTKLKRDI